MPSPISGSPREITVSDEAAIHIVPMEHGESPPTPIIRTELASETHDSILLPIDGDTQETLSQGIGEAARGHRTFVGSAHNSKEPRSVLVAAVPIPVHGVPQLVHQPSTTFTCSTQGNKKRRHFFSKVRSKVVTMPMLGMLIGHGLAEQAKPVLQHAGQG